MLFLSSDSPYNRTLYPRLPHTNLLQTLFKFGAIRTLYNSSLEIQVSGSCLEQNEPKKTLVYSCNIVYTTGRLIQNTEKWVMRMKIK